jgi:hypothetical protein
MADIIQEASPIGGRALMGESEDDILGTQFSSFQTDTNQRMQFMTAQISNLMSTQIEKPATP